MNECVWITEEETDNVYYCEIKRIHRDELFGLIRYEVFPIIGSFEGFTILITGILTDPCVCIIQKGLDRPYGKACYDLNKLINNEG